jgi:hypothetical protein
VGKEDSARERELRMMLGGISMRYGALSRGQCQRMGTPPREADHLALALLPLCHTDRSVSQPWHGTSRPRGAPPLPFRLLPVGKAALSWGVGHAT